LFTSVPATHSHLTFSNAVIDDPSMNIINYLYFYDGGGVSVGDVNHDGLMDLYFSASSGPNHLYLNKGRLVFEDVTEAAGVAGTADWTKGVTMADVNGDGWVDIYVSTVTFGPARSRNELFINNGDGTFTNRAKAFGLDNQGLSTQAVFFDYDLDGDLDVYLVNHSNHDISKREGIHQRTVFDPLAGDKLLRNDGNHFSDVSAEAGIYGSAIGYGLAAVASDLNLDGCPDLYVSNDFFENDYLYFNNCDGTFTESVYNAMGHTSLSSMGNDAADVNNDGRPDVVVTDMLPERADILNSAVGPEAYDIYLIKRHLGFLPQFRRNTLQINRGEGHFSDLGPFAGITATDWSWADLLADLDNDGYKDLFITNGINHRPNDLEYLHYVASASMQRILQKRIPVDTLQALLGRMPHIPIPNVAFHNDGDLTFTDRAAEWGLGKPGFSNGAAYADLDNDGDLDLIVNNLNAPVSLFENRASDHTRYLTVALKGEGANTAGVGTKIMVRAGGQAQLLEQFPTRGWESSVDPRLHFGLGPSDVIDTLTVVWPDRRFQTLTGIAVDTLITLRQEDAGGRYEYPAERPAHPLFMDVTDAIKIDYRHRENRFIDFSREPLMPHLISTEGPALAVGDVNDDGLDDLFAGGGKRQPARLLIQSPDGRFSPSNEALWQADSLFEDVDAAFFDADGDGDRDLYVVSAGNEFWGKNHALADRLYRNDGSGGFSRAEGALPGLFANGCCVVPGDYDGDGDLDLFVGSRVVAKAYGTIPPSYLLENDGSGHFTDVTADRAPSLATAGMVTAAAWGDVDGDGELDIVVAGEWMPVRVFGQKSGRFFDRTDDAGLNNTNGFWNALELADMDGDGDLDLIAGNLGLNTMLRATPDSPLHLYLTDLDHNGRTDPLFTFEQDGTTYLLPRLDDLIQQVPALRRTYTTYPAFGAGRFETVVSGKTRNEAVVRSAYVLTSSYFENRGDGTFAMHALPSQAQWTTIEAILAMDVDEDGRMDLVLGGNFDGQAPRIGRSDAGYGTLLRGDGQGGFAPVAPVPSGLWLSGQIRALSPIHMAHGGRYLIAARNDDRLQVLRINKTYGGR